MFTHRIRTIIKWLTVTQSTRLVSHSSQPYIFIFMNSLALEHSVIVVVIITVSGVIILLLCLRHKYQHRGKPRRQARHYGYKENLLRPSNVQHISPWTRRITSSKAYTSDPRILINNFGPPLHFQIPRPLPPAYAPPPPYSQDVPLRCDVKSEV